MKRFQNDSYNLDHSHQNETARRVLKQVLCNEDYGNFEKNCFMLKTGGRFVRLKYNLTYKRCPLTDLDREKIEFYVEKLDSLLRDLPKDIPMLYLYLKKNRSIFLPISRVSRPKKDWGKPKMAVYEASLNLRLPQILLNAKSQGVTIEECLGGVFDRLIKEIKKFKGTHFSSQSDYPNKRSIKRLS